MPDLGKAIYSLVFDTREGEVAVSGMEARADKAAAGISKSMGMAEKSVAAVGAEASRAEAQLALFGTEGSAAMKEVAASAEEMGAATTVAGDKAMVAGDKASAGAKKAEAAWKKTATSMNKIGKTMSHAVTLPVLAIAGVGTKDFLEYSQRIQLLHTQAGATTAEMNKMRGAVLNLAKGTTQGPTDLANAMFRVESDIHRVNGRIATAGDKLSILHAAADGATLGISNLDETTYALVGTMNSGIKGAEKASTTMATLSAIVGQGDMHLEDLTAALSTGVIPQTVLAGLKLSDLGAALAVMTSRNIPAQKSATYLGTAFAMLMKPTNQMKEAFHELGMGSMDMARIMRAKGLGPALVYFNQHLAKIKDKTDAARIALGALGGQKSGKALLLLTTQAQDFNDRLGKINGNIKNYNKNVKAAKEEPINKLKTAWSSVQVSLVKIGAIVAPIVVHIMNGIASVADAFGRLPHAAQTGIVAFALVAAAVGPLLILFSKVLKAVGFLAKAFGILGTSAEAAAGAEAGAAGAATGVGALSIALSVGLVAAAAAAGIALGILLDKIKVVRSVGTAFGKGLYKSAAQFGLVASGEVSAGQQAVGKLKAPAIRFIFGRYRSLLKKGMGPDQAISILQTQHPNLDMNYMLRNSKGEAFAPTGAVPQSYNMPPAPKKPKPNPKNPLDGEAGGGLTWKDIMKMGLGLGSDPTATPKKLQIKGIESGEFLPAQLQMDLLNAQGPGGTPAKAQATLKRQLAFLQKYKRTHKLATGTLIALQQEINSVNDEIVLGATRIKAALKKKAKKTGGVLGAKFGNLEVRRLAAEHTKGLGDDKNALQAEEKFLTHMLRNRKLSHVKRVAALKAQHSTDTALSSVTRKMLGGNLGGAFGTLMLGYMKAQHTKKLSDDKKALQAEERYLSRLLKQHNLSLATRKAALTAQHRADSALNAITSKIQRTKDQAFNDRLAIEQAKAELLGGKAGSAKLKKVQAEIRQHELKMLKSQEASIRKRLKDKSLSLHEQAKLWKQLVETDKKRLALLKKTKATENLTAKEIQAALNTRGTFFGEFAPNIFTKTGNGLVPGATTGAKSVHHEVHQHNTFHELPKDRFRLARQMRDAMVKQTAFDG
jgi:TP901 family phage tail tape measure protein